MRTRRNTNLPYPLAALDQRASARIRREPELKDAVIFIGEKPRICLMKVEVSKFR
jgi:hypothetical protein